MKNESIWSVTNPRLIKAGKKTQQRKTYVLSRIIHRWSLRIFQFMIFFNFIVGQSNMRHLVEALTSVTNPETSKISALLPAKKLNEARLLWRVLRPLSRFPRGYLALWDYSCMTRRRREVPTEAKLQAILQPSFRRKRRCVGTGPDCQSWPMLNQNSQAFMPYHNGSLDVGHVWKDIKLEEAVPEGADHTLGPRKTLLWKNSQHYEILYTVKINVFHVACQHV